MRFDLGPIEALESAPLSGGTPLMLAVDSIDEDPAQPRIEFDLDALQELAATIRTRGVRQPISVRPHPEQPERWMLNFGSRRLRASKLAGNREIPAFVDLTADGYDQVIENEQREGLKPLELALFVQRRIATGDSQAEIARRLGKSRPYVTYASALIDAPDWLMALYRDGRCRGLRELHELRQLQINRPEVVRLLESDREPITRERVNAIKAALLGDPSEVTQMGPGEDTAATTTVATVISRADIATAPSRAPVSVSSVRTDERRHDSTPAYTLLADLEGTVVEVLVDSAPSEDGKVFVSNDAEDTRHAVPATDLRLMRIVARRDR